MTFVASHQGIGTSGVGEFEKDGSAGQTNVSFLQGDFFASGDE